MDDKPPLMHSDTSAACWARLARARRPVGPRRRLPWRLLRLAGTHFVGASLTEVVSLALTYVQILALQTVLLPGGGSTPWVKWTAVAALFAGPAFSAITDVLMNTLEQRVAIRMRASLFVLLYRKGARLDLAASDYRLGEIVSLMSSDINSIVAAITYFNLTWQPIAQLAITLVLLTNVIGTAVVGAFIFMAVALPVQTVLFGKIFAMTKEFMRKRDLRMELVTEILQSVRVLKMMAFERQSARRIAEKRKDELEVLKWLMIVLAGLIVLVISMPSLIGVAVFVVRATVLGDEMNASTAFTTLALLDSLRMALFQLPMMVNFVMTGAVSLGRVERFLNRSEVRLPPPHGAGGVARARPPAPAATTSSPAASS